VRRPAALALFALALAASGCQTSPEQPAADTDITILTTDLEAQPMGEGQDCVALLSKIVDPGYVEEHGIDVQDRTTAELAIENAITRVCEGGPPEQSAHEASHQVIDLVAAELDN
jgi:hypothetical protein